MKDKLNKKTNKKQSDFLHPRCQSREIVCFWNTWRCIFPVFFLIAQCREFLKDFEDSLHSVTNYLSYYLMWSSLSSVGIQYLGYITLHYFRTNIKFKEAALYFWHATCVCIMCLNNQTLLSYEPKSTHFFCHSSTTTESNSHEIGRTNRKYRF